MIYTTREINVNGNTATIDEDIYLFKQDSNIELKFIINNTRFTFQTTESTNVVESSNASYFRVKLLNPYGKTINFPIQEVTDNFIVLLITGELIDEDTEVGDYTIQIRLYDKDKNSKLTLPAITNCIHIQQPIFSEVEESTVDTAAIDTAMVMETDEGELPVVDSTGKYIPTVWNTGDTISKAKINHIEKGILQAHTEALNNKIPKVTPPKGQTTSDIIKLYKMLPDDGLVYLTEGCMIQNTGLIGLCSIYSYASDEKELSKNNIKSITCYYTGVCVDITSAGAVVETGLTNEDLSSLMEVLRDPQRKTGQVFTMVSDSEYGWADVIPQITPPDGQDTSDIINIYNELPDNGLVFFTNEYGFADAFIVGLCSVGAYTTEKGVQAKTIICTSNALYVNITSTGDILNYGISNLDLDNLMNTLNNERRTKGQVLTMTSDSEYGWQDVIPHITPPKGQGTSDIISLYNKLPEKGLVYFTNEYYISDALIIGLCYIDPYTDNKKPAKTIICTSTVMYVNITSTGDISGTGIANDDLDGFVTNILKNPDRKKGQVLTMTSNSEYGWADTTPKLCIHNITGNAEVELTLDPYQLINISDATPQDLSPKYTVDILTPNIEESDNHVYKIHVIFTGYSNVNYIMPSGMYNYPTDEFTAEKVYEFIFTYVKPKWIVNGSEYSIHSNAPQ